MAETDPLIGKKLGDYSLVDLLGRGGMARVYRGYDARLDRYAAVKVTEAQHVPPDEQDEYHRRFQAEARAIARLQHPNIVGIYQFGQAGAAYYMAMAFIEGRDLRRILRNHARSGTRMAYAEILRVMHDIGAALDYAHQQGVIHRDVKSSNIMVTPDGHAVLTDFGLALHLSDGTTGNTFGTAHYIAPEQAVSSAQVVPQSDLYSLGIVLYEMLTNRLPFDDPSAVAVAMMHLNQAPPPPSAANPDLPPALDAVVLKALEKDPAQRYASGQEFARALETALRDNGMLAGVADSESSRALTLGDQQTLVETPLPRRRRLRRLLVAAALLAPLLVLVAAARLLAVTSDLPDTPTLAPATALPTTVLPTTAPTLAPLATATLPPAGAVTLKYDQQGLVVWNQTGRTVDVSDLAFVQTTADGKQLLFESNRWAGGSRPVEALPAGDCFQVYRDDLPDMAKPDYCEQRHAWRRVAFPRWFWISADPAATFEVRRGSAVLARCRVSDSVCTFDPG